MANGYILSKGAVNSLDSYWKLEKLLTSKEIKQIRNKTNTRRSTWKNNEVNRRKLPNENYKPKVHLTEKEKEICNRVINKFKNFTTKELVDYMHKEKAYIDTKPNEVIDFSYAKFVEI